MKVLVVERSRVHQTVLARIFTGEGIIVSLADNFKDAFERLDQEDIDIVCTCYQLDNNKTGIQLTQKIRQLRKYEQIPIILMASLEKGLSTEQVYNSGVTEICTRYTFDDLSEKIRSLLSRRILTISANILYIEDSKTAAALTKKDLKETNITFDHFLSADDAFEAYKTNHKNYDMVITDVVVEGNLDGLSFVRAIREMTPEIYKMPILAVSGFDDTSRRVELLRSGANDYIVKPYVKEEFLVRVKNLITTKHLFDQVAIQQEQLYQQATKDHLTGLHNRHALESFITKLTSAAIRHKKPIGILFLDIDHFKAINDIHGHIIGDNVLEQLGKMISSSFRGEDFSARYGGEEFVVILFNTTFEQTKMIAEKFRQQVENTKFCDLDITISIGALASMVTAETNINILFNRADEALYQAKENGRNQTCSVNLGSVQNSVSFL